MIDYVIVRDSDSRAFEARVKALLAEGYQPNSRTSIVDDGEYSIYSIAMAKWDAGRHSDANAEANAYYIDISKDLGETLAGPIKDELARQGYKIVPLDSSPEVFVPRGDDE